MSIDSTAISRTHAPDLIPGYRLEKLVGSGGMGEVHKATQLSLGRTVAIKLLSPHLAQDESFVARFQKEAAALATLHHPHIVSILDKGSTPTTYYLVMEFVDGASLRERMRSPHHTPLEALRMMMEICRAIEYAHHRGVIHRDLKPENILFDDQAGGIAKVTDFGLASFLDDASSRFALTSTHVAMGTLSYMAPEQRVDAKNADERADIFALGLILYELLVGELPAGHFDPPSHRKPELDPRLDGIIARCLKQTPADRYPSVTALLADLEPLAPNYTTLRPVQLSRMQRMGQSVRRVVRGVFQAVATLAVLAALLVLGLAWHRSGEKQVPVEAGATLAAEPPPRSMQQSSGRVDTRGIEHSATVGEGSDVLSLVVYGRPIDLQDKALVFPPVEDPPHVGLARLNVVGLEGDDATLAARVTVEAPPPTDGDRVRGILFGPPQEPQAALMLLGSTGRYVALVHSGVGAPLRLEWALGQRRGTMLGAPSPQGPTDFSLEVEAGVLRAYLGTKRDKRQIAEPLDLGDAWQKEFGDSPKPGFGCIAGACRADNFSYTLRRTTDSSLVPAAHPLAPRQEVRRRR